MPYNSSLTLNLGPYDFRDTRPAFALSSSTYNPNLIFANQRANFHVDDDQLGYVTFSVTYSGDIDYLSVCFTAPNDQRVSVATNPNYLFLPSSTQIPVEWVILDGTNNTPGPQTFYVVVNGSNLTDIVNIQLAAGVYGVPSSGVSLFIDYTCTTQIHSYETGLHVYSPFDAQSNVAKLKTKLYSFTPIENWTIDTMVYSTSLLQNAALPWYYGYGDNVFKVGGPFDRAFGTQILYRIKKKRFRKPKKYREVVGPRWWINDPNDQPSHPNCVAPIMTDLGLIKQIYPNNSLDRPLKYRYYMGYDAVVKQTSNNEVFVIWNWNTSQRYPIIGSKHALLKLLKGIMEGYRYEGGYINDYDGEYDPYSTDFGMAAQAVFDAGNAVLIVAGVVCTFALGASGGNQGSGCPGSPTTPSQTYNSGCPQVPVGPGTSGGVASNNPAGSTGGSGNVSVANVLLIICLAIAAVAALLYIVGLLLLLVNLIRDWLTQYNKVFTENCTTIRHFFCDTPYVSGNTNTTLFRNLGSSVIYNGFHNDGCYLYTQNGSRVINKEQNFITSSFDYIDNTGVVYYSPQYATLPDVPTLVEDFAKLVILCYTSGKPLPYCGGNTIYYNQQFQTTLGPKELNCCDLQKCEEIVVTLSAGTTWSCVSQSDANSQAELLFNYLTAYTVNNNNYVSLPSNAYGDLDCAFTHEIKIEDNPNYLSLTFDARISPTPVIGMKLYYDDFGCTPVMDGFYATSGTTPFRTFYHTTNGRVDSIETMATSASTTTSLGNSVSTINKDYTSNWYLTENTQTILDTWSNELADIKRFDPNILYTGYTLTLTSPPVSHSYTLKKGFIKTPVTIQNFQLYDNFNTTSYSQAPYGWYRPLSDWLDNPSFLYNPGRQIYVNVTEICDYIYGNTPYRAVTVDFTSDNLGTPTSPDVNINLTLNFYNSSGVLITTRVLNLGTSSQQTFNLTSVLGANDVNTIVISNLQLLSTSLSTYFIGDTQSCTTKICNQTWMAQNLAKKFYNNGDPIPLVTDASQWASLTTGAFCFVNNDSSTASRYGLIYNYYAVSDPRGLAPSGWTVASGTQWTTLSTCLGGDLVSGGVLKESGLRYWNPPNSPATDTYNFSARGAGYRSGGNGSFGSEKIETGYWVGNSGNAGLAEVRVLQFNTALFPAGVTTQDTGYSVRIIKN